MHEEELVTTFASRSLVVVLVTALALGWVVSWRISSTVTRDAVRAASATAGAVVGTLLEEGSLDGRLDGSDAAAMDELLSGPLGDVGVFALKVWNAQGVLVYSSNEGDSVGEVVVDDEVGAALAGETVSKGESDSDPGDEHANQLAEGGDLLEVYAPLTADGGTYGVFEIYQRYGPIEREIREVQGLVWIVVLGTGFLGYAVQIGIVRRAARRLREAEGRVLEIEERLESSIGRLERHSLGTLAGLINAVDAKDSYTASHSMSVTEYATALGVQLCLPEEDRRLLERAALLHDIGKIGIPEAVLLKPGRLSEEERAVIQDHSDMGARIVGAIPFLQDLVPAVRHHHERWDGTGYPDGLGGEEIPIAARVLAVADAFDAMTSDRPYREAKTVDFAMTELAAHGGRQFDPVVVDAMMHLVGVPGTAGPLVRPSKAAVATT